MGAKVDRLAAAERRRRIILALLASAIIGSTLPVTNERALFSPYGEMPTIGNLSPVAYAVTFGFRNPPLVGRGGSRPPVAYAFRVPPEFSENPIGLLPVGPADPIGFGNLVPALPNELGSRAAPFSFIGPDPFGPSGGVRVARPIVASIPEPATWITMISGFALIGAAMRRNRRRNHTKRASAGSSE